MSIEPERIHGNRSGGNPPCHLNIWYVADSAECHPRSAFNPAIYHISFFPFLVGSGKSTLLLRLTGKGRTVDEIRKNSLGSKTQRERRPYGPAHDEARPRNKSE